MLFNAELICTVAVVLLARLQRTIGILGQLYFRLRFLRGILILHIHNSTQLLLHYFTHQNLLNLKNYIVSGYSTQLVPQRYCFFSKNANMLFVLHSQHSRPPAYFWIFTVPLSVYPRHLVFPFFIFHLYP